MADDLLIQAGKAIAYYAALVVMMRLAGKRLAGQTTTFDLIVLITLAAVLQGTALQAGPWYALVFVATVFTVHWLVAAACARSAPIRHLVRGKPRALVRDGQIVDSALKAEGVSREELLAGLRKLGYDGPARLKLATLEETGHISAVEK
jgi:uncharacterized membrane protein YcaP (DUF421 family)